MKFYIHTLVCVCQAATEYEYYPDCDDPDNFEDVFRVEGFVDFYDVTYAAAQTWRDEVNKKGGMCVDSSCSQKMNVSVVIAIPLVTVTSSLEFITACQKYYSSILHRDASELPRALITPLGSKYIDPILSLFHENNVYIPIFPLTNEPFTITLTNLIAIMPTYNYNANSFVNVLTNRYGIGSVVITGAGGIDGYLYKTADYVAKLIKSRGITILGKKCSSTVNLFDGKDCETDNDCNSDEICRIPQIQNDYASSLDKELYIYNWVEYFKKQNPDGVILLCDKSMFLTFVDSMRLSGWAPKFASSYIQNSLTLDEEYNLYPTFWHTGLLFSKEMNSGKSGEYFGTSSEWYDLVNKTYVSKYLNPATHSFGDVIMDHYVEDVAFGSAVGITIEKGLSMIDGVYNDSDIYEQGELLVQAIHYLGVCSNNENKKCSLDSDCGNNNDVICKPWNTFYGDILINKENGVNYKKQYIIGQVQYTGGGDSSSENNSTTIEMKFVYPSTLTECNKNTQCLETNFESCSCKAIYPAKWPWEIMESDDAIYVTDTVGVIHLIIILILMIVVITFLIYVLYSKETVFGTKDYRGIYTIFYFALIFLLSSLCFLFGQRTNFLCSGYVLLDIIGDTLIYLSLFTTTYVKIKTINNETIDMRSIWRNVCSIIIVMISLLILWILTEPPKGETNIIIENNIKYRYYYCGLTDFTISFFIAEYIVIAFGLLLNVKLWYIERSSEIFLLIFQISLICMKSLIFSILFLAFNNENETIVDNLFFVFDYVYIFLSLSSLVCVKMYSDPKRNSKVASDTKITNTKELERFSKLLLDHIYMVHFDMFLKEYNLNYYTDFVEHVFKYRNITDPSGSSELLKKIYHNFIMDDSPNPIALSEETRNTIKKHLDNNELDTSLYDESLLEALQFLYKHNYIDQFKRSKYIPMIEKSNKILKYFESLSPAVLHGVVESMKKSLEETENKEVDITKSSNTNIINSKSIVGVGNGSICNRNQLSTVNINMNNNNNNNGGGGSQPNQIIQQSNMMITPRTTTGNTSSTTSPQQPQTQQTLVQPTQIQIQQNQQQQLHGEKISQHTTSITGQSSTSNSGASHTNNNNMNNINAPGMVTSLNDEEKSDKFITGAETFSNE